MSTKQKLIQIIHSYYNQYHTTPSCRQLGIRTERFRYHFGSFAQALLAAGIPTQPPLPKTQRCAREDCNNTFKPRERSRKFCSQSCAGKTHSTGRACTEETKHKIRKTFVTNHPVFCKVYFKCCESCGKPFVSRTGGRKMCSDVCRNEVLSMRAISNPAFGGNRSRNFTTYASRSGLVYTLDSSWEVRLATTLDNAGIEWIRPTEPLLYVDGSGKTRRYFPDFYILKYDLYVDTKNPWRLTVDMDKLSRVAQQRNISLLILSNKNEIRIDNVRDYTTGLHIIGADGETRTHDGPEYETGAIAAMRRQP